MQTEPTTGPASEPTSIPEPASANQSPTLDLDLIERDLADVEAALQRLDDGTYWVDEVTGETLPAEWLAEHPTVRRTPPE